MKPVPGAFAPGGRRDGTFYRQLIRTIGLAVGAPVVAAGAIYLWVSVSAARAGILEESAVSTAAAAADLEHLLESVERSALDLASAPLIRGSFSVPDFNRDYFYHMQILEELQMVLDGDDAIDEIIYSNALTGLVLSTRYGYKLAVDFYLPRDLVAARQGSTPARWTFLPDTPDSLSFARHLPPLWLGTPQGALVIRLNSRLRSVAERARAAIGAEALLIFDSQGRPLLDGPPSAGFHDPLGDENLRRILDTSDKSGSFVGRPVSGESHIYAFARPTLRRTYVAVVPRAGITGRVFWTSTVIVLSLALVVAAAIAISIAGSRRIYSPIFELARLSTRLAGRGDAQGNEVGAIRECIAHLNEEIEALRGFLKEKVPALRRQLLREMISGESTLQAGELAAEAAEYGLPVGCRYAVLAVNVDGAGEDRGGGEAPGALAEVLDDWLRGADLEPAAALRGSFCQAVVVVFLDGDAGRDDARAAALADAARGFLADALAADASVGMGRPVADPGALAAAHREAVIALQHCSLRGAHTLSIADVESGAVGAFLYPREIEREIVAALADQDRDQAAAALQRFAAAVLASGSLPAIRQCYDVLLSSIVFSFQDLGGNIMELMEHDLYDQLHARASPRAKQAWFVRALFPLFVARVVEVQKARRRSALARIRGFIRDNITADVSLVRCADVVSLSPSYISRLFKAELGVSFIEYVLRAKVDEAKARLRETDSSIGEIAAAIGYSERSLYRIFQRIAGMNPNAYRRAQR